MKTTNFTPALVFALICIGGVNLLLGFSILEGKALLANLESELGRPLTGAGLERCYEKFNAHYENGRMGRAFLIWIFHEELVPWSIISALVCGFLGLISRRKIPLVAGFVGVAVFSLIVIAGNAATIERMGAWLE